MSIEVSTVDWPMVRAEFNGDLTVADEQDYEQYLTEFLATGECFAVLETGEPSGSGERRALAKRLAFLRDNSDALAARLAGVAVISSQEAIEMITEALAAGKAKNVLKRIVFPQQSFVSETEAVSWLRQCLADTDGYGDGDGFNGG